MSPVLCCNKLTRNLENLKILWLLFLFEELHEYDRSIRLSAISRAWIEKIRIKVSRGNLSHTTALRNYQIESHL